MTVPPLTLTTALALLGVGVVLALVIYNMWSTRRLRPKTGAAEFTASRLEPALEGQAGSTQAPAAFADTHPGPLAHVPPRPARVEPRLDALIDAIVPLALDAPISAEFALLHLPPSRRAGSKPFYAEGLDADTGEWTLLLPGHRYSELQIGVQMVNRTGALNEIEYSEFVQMVQAVAEAIGARPDLPDMLEVVARARELDGLASPLDAQLNVTLRSNAASWSVPYVQQLAGRQGFVHGNVPGRLVLPAAEEGAPPVLVLAMDPQAALAEDPQAAGVRECTLMLDVPQTAELVEAFPLFHLTATSLASDLDATAVDNEGVPITLQAYAAIGQELTQLYRQLEALDLPAGSPAARRLFS
jgi:hypothetical protein